MMPETLVTSLLGAISKPRFDRYLAQAGDNEAQSSLTCYLWNTLLSESLYPVLQGVEVTLRNSIHKAASEKFGSAGWMDSVLVDPEKRYLNAARENLQNRDKDTGPDNLMSELNFGFWAGLFHHRYEGIFWPQMLRAVFPYMPRERRTRQYIFGRLWRTRQLRNRVFHYEPIWYWNNLDMYHRETLDLIRWINPDMAGMVGLADRFPAVYAQGSEVWREALLRLGGSELP